MKVGSEARLVFEKIPVQTVPVPEEGVTGVKLGKAPLVPVLTNHYSAAGILRTNRKPGNASPCARLAYLKSGNAMRADAAPVIFPLWKAPPLTARMNHK